MHSKHRVTVNLSAEDHRTLALLAEISCVSQAWIARRALVEFLERHQDDQLQLPFELARLLQRNIEQVTTATNSASSVLKRRSLTMARRVI